MLNWNANVERRTLNVEPHFLIRGGDMKKLAVLLTMALVMALICPVQGKTPYLPDEALQAGARQGFEQILDLWRDGKYDELYERTISSGKETKERFIARLAGAHLKPACCWEKMQDVKVSAKKENAVTVRAKVGLQGGMGSEFKTRSFKLVKEDGVWKISQADLLSLSGGSKKIKRYVKRK
jgi:hypothetical protein